MCSDLKAEMASLAKKGISCACPADGGLAYINQDM
jgi:hypothetical protein